MTRYENLPDNPSKKGEERSKPFAGDFPMDSIFLFLAFVGLAMGLAWGGYSARPEHGFLRVLSYIGAVGCVTGAIAVAILTPIYNGKIEALNNQIAALKASPSSAATPSYVAEPLPTLESSTASTETKTPKPAPSPITTERIGNREFVNVSPKFLVELVNRNTSIQGERLIQGFIGKWLNISGQVENVRQYSAIKQSVVTFTYYYPDPEEGPSFYAVNMWFNSKWLDRTAALSKGTRIAVEGKISKIDDMAVDLDDCEFMPAP